MVKLYYRQYYRSTSKLSKLIEQFLSNPAEVRFEEVQYVLEAFGFEEKRSKGSHHSFVDPQGRVLIVPKKSGKTVKIVYIKRVVELLNLETWQEEIERDDER